MVFFCTPCMHTTFWVRCAVAYHALDCNGSNVHCRGMDDNDSSTKYVLETSVHVVLLLLVLLVCFISVSSRVSLLSPRGHKYLSLTR